MPLREACGVFAAAGTPDAARLVVLGLHALQHRGQEAAGVAVLGPGGASARIGARRGAGRVDRVFSAEAAPVLPPGRAAVGHVRYSTSGAGAAAEVQPLVAETRLGPVALAHNGALTNTELLRAELLESGVGLSSRSDSELILRLLAAARAPRIEGALEEAAARLAGAWSLAVLSRDALVAARDPAGMRPLVLGRLGGALVLASETCALDLVGAEHIRDIAPGEVLRLPLEAPAPSMAPPLSTAGSPEAPPPSMAPDGAGAPSVPGGALPPSVDDGVASAAAGAAPEAPPPGRQPALAPLEAPPQGAPERVRAGRFCSFEHVYFMRPDSRFLGLEVAEARRRLGAALHAESPAPADAVVPVPDSGLQAAVGMAEAAGLPFRHGIVRNHFVGRTFIEPEAPIRHLGVRLKLSAAAESVRGLSIALVDDSIVRGSTMPKIVALLRRAGAREVHVRVASPPFRWPCHYGIDIPGGDDLVASRLSLERLEALVGADSLAFLSTEGLRRALGDARAGGPRGFCDACFTGDYPVARPDLDAGLPLGRDPAPPARAPR